MANKKKSETDEIKNKKKKSVTKVNTTRTKKIIAKTKTATKKAASTKATKTTKKTTVKKDTKAKAKKTTTKSKTSTAKTAAKKKTTTTKVKATKVSSNKKAVTTDKPTNKKPRSKKIEDNDKITANTNLTEEFNSSEYYDLPFTYNQTIVKILAQTPETLFVYWDISEEDRKKYVKQFGENFFNDTKPVLIITNKTMNYTFEVDINDFANSWYLHVNDAKCEYHIELGRRPISKYIDIPNNYISVASSNVIENQNDHILFEKDQKMVYFKNVKTNVVTEKPITTLSFLNNMGKIYNIYDIYHKLYKDENFEDVLNPSSVFK